MSKKQTHEKQQDNEDLKIETASTAQSASEIEPTDQSQTIAQLKKELAQAHALVADYKDRQARTQAESINQRQRMEREAIKSKQFALEGFAKALLPVIDSLERCVNTTTFDDMGDQSPHHALTKNMHQGMKLTLVMLIKAVNKFGIEQLNPVGEKFNPEHHEAVSTHQDEKAKPDTVLEVLEKGYLLNKRLIRPAMVVVVA